MPGIGKSVQRLHWWFPGARGEMGVTATEHRVSLWTEANILELDSRVLSQLEIEHYSRAIFCVLFKVYFNKTIIFPKENTES